MISVSLLLIYLRVRAIEKKIQQYGMGTSSAASAQLSKKTGWQAMRYIGAFFICQIGLIILPFGPDDGGENTHVDFYFPIAILVILMVPLQGFLNAIIFFHNHPSVLGKFVPLSAIHRRVCCRKRHGRNVANRELQVPPKSSVGRDTDHTGVTES